MSRFPVLRRRSLLLGAAASAALAACGGGGGDGAPGEGAPVWRKKWLRKSEQRLEWKLRA